LGLLCCEACALVFSPELWREDANEEANEQFFGEGYEQHQSLWVQRFEQWNNRRTLRRVRAAGVISGRLLEIGVGSGSFMHAAKVAGFEVMGADLSAPVCGRVSARYGIPVHCGGVDTLSGEGLFEVVVMNHVLEHTARPVSCLQHVSRLLTVNGVAHIAVPNVRSWDAHLSGWTSFEPYHLTYFDSLTLRRAVESSNLRVERLCTHESFSGWFLALLRTALGVNRPTGALADQTRRIKFGLSPRRAIVEHAYRLAMVGVGAVTYPLRFVQAVAGYGDELVCISRKA
jgi:2-polyprenyl-3-methyl-5-hydroxy-6-metoxy-1,4-benzoquinol methylase